jgi:antitoxin component YwqK of YwqJK toxin-antitoxin module
MVAVLLGVGAVALVVSGWFLTRPRPQPVEATAAIADLVRVDGRLMLRADTNRVFSGWLVEESSTGTPRSRSQIKDGVLNGVSEGWYTNGQIQVREHYVQGVADGVRVKWHANGATQSVATIANGKLTGRFLRWHDDGSLAEEVAMLDGQPDGLSRAYYPSGFVKAEVQLKAGQVVEKKFWKDGEVPAGASGSADPSAGTRNGS